MVLPGISGLRVFMSVSPFVCLMITERTGSLPWRFFPVCHISYDGIPFLGRVTNGLHHTAGRDGSGIYQWDAIVGNVTDLCGSAPQLIDE
jgi:hypothetical protein